MDQTTQFFGEGSVARQFGNPKLDDPKLQWLSFVQQLNCAAAAADSSPEWAHYLHSDATYRLIHGADHPRPADDAPEQPPNNAGAGPWDNYKDAKKSRLARKAAERRLIDSDFSRAIHENHFGTFSEEINGVNIGTIRRTLPEIYNLGEAAYGTADIHAIRSVTLRLTQVYNPSQENFKSYRARFMRDHAFLERNNELPPGSQLFDSVKAAVANCMAAATESFEQARQAAEWTMPNLMDHLEMYFDRHSATITAHNAINEVKATGTAKPRTATTTEKQIAELMGKVPSAEASARIERAMQNAMKRAVQNELHPKLCAHCPHQVSHTTEQCGTERKKKAAAVKKYA